MGKSVSVGMKGRSAEGPRVHGAEGILVKKARSWRVLKVR